MTEVKFLPVLEKIAGERADAGLAKLLGVSRTVAADLLAQGLVESNGKSLSKSDHLQ